MLVHSAVVHGPVWLGEVVGAARVMELGGPYPAGWPPSPLGPHQQAGLQEATSPGAWVGGLLVVWAGFCRLLSSELCTLLAGGQNVGHWGPSSVPTSPDPLQTPSLGSN